MSARLFTLTVHVRLFVLVSPTLCCRIKYISLYPPSERSKTGGYTVFTFVCLCVSVRTQSSLQQCDSSHHSPCSKELNNIISPINQSINQSIHPSIINCYFILFVIESVTSVFLREQTQNRNQHIALLLHQFTSPVVIADMRI